MHIVVIFIESYPLDWCEFAVVVCTKIGQCEVVGQPALVRNTFMKMFLRRFSNGCSSNCTRQRHPSAHGKLPAHRGFVLPRKGNRKNMEILYPKPRPQKRPHFTTNNMGTHSGCPSSWRSFVFNFGSRCEAHVSCTEAGPQKQSYQTQGRSNICPRMPMFCDSGHNASRMVP